MGELGEHPESPIALWYAGWSSVSTGVRFDPCSGHVQEPMKAGYDAQ
jgi:hypothetical protein